MHDTNLYLYVFNIIYAIDMYIYRIEHTMKTHEITNFQQGTLLHLGEINRDALLVITSAQGL